MFKKFEKFESKITMVILGFIMIFSLFSNYLSRFFDIPENWEISVVFLALFLIVNMLKDLDLIRDNTTNLVNAHGVDCLEKFDTYEKYYKALHTEISKATISIDVTHIRHEPPTVFSSGKNYYESVEKWCQSNKSGYFRRITVDTNDDMKSWINTLSSIEKNNSNYHIRIAKWNSEFPMINMSIIDNKTVFLALTGDIPDKTHGIKIKDVKTAEYFSSYFNNVWATSKTISQTKQI